jgi:hypothetical protein
MKKFIVVAGLAALVFAAGIGVAEFSQAADKGAPAAQTALHPGILVGRWGDNGDCRADVMFMPDGRFHSYTGGDGRWTLQGDRLTMAGDGGVFELRLSLIDADHIQTVSADGSINMSNRCD